MKKNSKPKLIKELRFWIDEEAKDKKGRNRLGISVMGRRVDILEMLIGFLASRPEAHLWVLEALTIYMMGKEGFDSAEKQVVMDETINKHSSDIAEMLKRVKKDKEEYQN